MKEYAIEKVYKSDREITVETDSVFCYHTHMHTFYEMTYYQPFAGSITINDKTFEIQKPTAVLIVPSDFHKISVQGTSASKFIKISFTTDILPPNITPDASRIMPAEPNSFFVQAFQELLKNKENEPYKTALVHALVCTMSEKGRPIRTPAASSGYILARDAVKIIHENFCNHLTLTSAAKKLSVSPPYLSAVFKTNMGIPFSQFLSDMRLRRAAALLSETEESITNICEMCGYRNFSHFLRSFKKAFQVSPSVYRKNHTKNTNTIQTHI